MAYNKHIETEIATQNKDGKLATVLFSMPKTKRLTEKLKTESRLTL